MCLVKILLGKILWEKNSSEGKRVHISFDMHSSLKTLPEKPSEKKPLSKEKECNAYYTPPD